MGKTIGCHGVEVAGVVSGGVVHYCMYGAVFVDDLFGEPLRVVGDVYNISVGCRRCVGGGLFVYVDDVIAGLIESLCECGTYLP